MKKMLIIYLCCIMTIICLVGCNKQGNTTSPQTPSTDINDDSGKIVIDKSSYFVKNGICNYKIVVPATHSDMLDVAVGEFIMFFQEATGITLPVIDDNNIVFNDESCYFSIGDTTIFKQVGLKVDQSMYNDGVFIRTVGHSIFLCGKTDRGTLYSVYKLLSILFNYDYFGRECYIIDHGVTDYYFRSVTLTESPTFDIRAAWGNGPEAYDVTNYRRLLHDDYLGGFLGVNEVYSFHNCLIYVDEEISEHEAYWYNQNKSNLCLTAHGDPAEYEALVECVTNKVKGVLRNNLERNKLLISINDGDPMCNCAACNELKRTYGANSASYILLCNDVRAKIEEWFHSNEGAPYYRDNFTFGLLAYMDTEDAPVFYNESTGKYEGINGIHCDEGVCVMFAPIYHDYTRPLTDSINANTYRNFKGWAALTDHLYYWGYDMNFQAYFAPYDTIGDMQEMMRFCKECGVEYYFVEGQQWTCKDTSAWANLHIYLNSKLGWNVDSNVQQLIEKFFKAFYGPASNTMYQLFQESRVYTTYLKDTYSNYGGDFSCETNTVKKEFWSAPLLKSWLDLYEQAYKDIEFLKDEAPEAYKQYYERIMTEEASPLYIMLSLFSNEISSSELEKYRERFYYITSTLDFCADFGEDIKTTWDAFGIKY